MDWTISFLNEWIGPVLGVTCESPFDSYCPCKPGNLHSEREKWENGKIYYSVKWAKDAFFVGYQSDKKWDIKVNLMFGAFFVFWKRQSVVFFCPCVLPCTYYKWKEKNACYKKRETNYDIGSTCQLRERGVCLWHRIINKWVAHTSSSPRGENGN